MNQAYLDANKTNHSSVSKNESKRPTSLEQRKVIEKQARREGLGLTAVADKHIDGPGDEKYLAKSVINLNYVEKPVISSQQEYKKKQLQKLMAENDNSYYQSNPSQHKDEAVRVDLRDMKRTQFLAD